MTWKYQPPSLMQRPMPTVVPVASWTGSRHDISQMGMVNHGGLELDFVDQQQCVVFGENGIQRI